MPKFEVEATFFVDAPTNDAAYRTVDKYLDGLYTNGGFGYEMSEGAATCATRYTATFTPEAWVRDQAIQVDAEGDTEWDCTDYLLEVCEESERTREIILAPLDSGYDDDPFGVLDNDDVLKDDPKAPEWVREWRGPFNIHVRVTEA